jgi:hypothetical protein
MTLLTEHNPLRNNYEADAKAAARWRDPDRLQRLMDDDLNLERAYAQMMKARPKRNNRNRQAGRAGPRCVSTRREADPRTIAAVRPGGHCRN